MYDSKSIRKTLESYGFNVYSVRKKKQMVGGRRFNLAERGLARQSHGQGMPWFYFQVDLLSACPADRHGNADYDFAVECLEAEGYKASHSPWVGLKVELPFDVQSAMQKAANPEVLS